MEPNASTPLTNASTELEQAKNSNTKLVEELQNRNAELQKCNTQLENCNTELQKRSTGLYNRNTELFKKLQKRDVDVMTERFEGNFQREKVARLERELRDPESLYIVKQLRSDLRERADKYAQQGTLIQKFLYEKEQVQTKLEAAELTANAWKQVAKRAIREAAALEQPQSALGKRAASGPSPAAPDPKKAKEDRYIPCTKCWTNGRECDNTKASCSECLTRGKGRECKRVMCRNFKAAACKRKGCKYAHEDDECPRLIPHMKLKPGHAKAQADGQHSDTGGFGGDMNLPSTMEEIDAMGVGEDRDDTEDDDGIGGIPAPV